MASETSTSNARDSMARAMASPSRPGAFAPRPPASLSAAGSSRALSARQAEAPPTRAAGAEHAKCVERERQGSSRAGFVDLDGGGAQPPPSACFARLSTALRLPQVQTARDVVRRRGTKAKMNVSTENIHFVD